MKVKHEHASNPAIAHLNNPKGPAVAGLNRLSTQKIHGKMEIYEVERDIFRKLARREIELGCAFSKITDEEFQTLEDWLARDADPTPLTGLPWGRLR